MHTLALARAHISERKLPFSRPDRGLNPFFLEKRVSGSRKPPTLLFSDPETLFPRNRDSGVGESQNQKCLSHSFCLLRNGPGGPTASFSFKFSALLLPELSFPSCAGHIIVSFGTWFPPSPWPLAQKLSCTRLRVPPVALHVSRYTCRN